MPDLISSMEFLSDIPLYDVEKPYYVMPSADADFDPEFATTNLEFTRHQDILFRDVRGHEAEFSIEKNGFQILKHESKNTILETVDQLNAYKFEIEQMLKELFKGVHAVCYESKESGNMLQQ